MAIDFWLLEQRRPPTAADIDTAVRKVKKLPDAGDAGHVMSPFRLAKQIPATTGADWRDAKQEMVKIRKLLGSTARLNRDNLIWHIRHPGQGRYRGHYNTHAQIVDDGEGLVIEDGHHRLAALLMLHVKRDTAWVLHR